MNMNGIIKVTRNKVIKPTCLLARCTHDSKYYRCYATASMG